MLQRLFPAHSEDIFRYGLRDERRIGPHGVCFREMSPYEYLQLSDPDKIRTVAYNGPKETFVPPVSAHLFIPVFLSRNAYGIKTRTVPEHFHERKQFKFPGR